MSATVQALCEALSPKLAGGPETRIVAHKIIELAQRGVPDVVTLQAMSLSAFKYE
jgi:hypothetical protein